MGNIVFDYEDGDVIYPTSGNMGFDSDGDLNMRISNNISLSLDTGEMHFNSGWGENDDE